MLELFILKWYSVPVMLSIERVPESPLVWVRSMRVQVLGSSAAVGKQVVDLEGGDLFSPKAASGHYVAVVTF
jgi:hypothetical protein